MLKTTIIATLSAGLAAAIAARLAWKRGRISGARYACRHGPALVAERDEHRAA